MIQIDLRSRTPIFEQIKNEIAALAVTGVWAPHDPLPSIRQLSHDLKLNVNTVKRAFSELEAAGVIYTLAGRGSFIAETAVSNEQLKAKALDGIRTAVRIGRANGVTLAEIVDATQEIFEGGSHA